MTHMSAIHPVTGETVKGDAVPMTAREIMMRTREAVCLHVGCDSYLHAAELHQWLDSIKPRNRTP